MNNIIVKQSQTVTATVSGTPSANRQYKFDDIPNLSRNLVRSNNGGFVILLEPRVINLTSCYIQVNDVLGLADGDKAIFNFYYDSV